MTIAAFRVPRDILGNPVPRCCLRTHAEVRRFIRPTHHLPASLMDGRGAQYVRQASGRGHGCSNNCLFLPLPVRSLIPARAKRAGNDAMRLCAMVAICTARPSACASLPSPFFRPDALAALINRAAAQTSGSHRSVHAPCSVVCSFAFTVAAASFLNPVTVRK